MKTLNLNNITKKIKIQKFPKFDFIVAIASGGLIPASLIASHLNLDLKILWLKFKDDKNKELYKKPKLLKKINFNFKNKKILLVDDFSKTGKTFNEAKNILKGSKIKTFAVNGKADYSLYNYKCCVKFPWK